jgi:hypothetical protein
MEILTAQRSYYLLDNEILWQTATRIHSLFLAESVDYAIVGGVAVCLHGYRRNTVDLDLLIRAEDTEKVRSILESDGLQWIESDKKFRTTSGVAIQFLIAGEKQGSGSAATFPDPSDPLHSVQIEGLKVLSLPALIQSKVASGAGNLRRTHKDFADVVELIVIHHLNRSFARKLHKSVRAEFSELVRHAKG